MQEVHFVGGQVRRMRPKDLVDLVPIRHVDFQVELRLRVAQFFPSVAEVPRLLFRQLLRRVAQNDGARLQRSGRAQYRIPKIVGSNHREPDGFPAFFRHRKRLRKQVLLDASEELIGFQFILARGSAPQQADVKHHNVSPPRFDAVQNVRKMIKIVVIADGDQDVSGFRAHGFGRQVTLQLQIELVHLHVSRSAAACSVLRDTEHDIEEDREGAARHGGDGLSEQIGDGDEKQREGNQNQTDRDLNAADIKVKGHLEFALARFGVPENQYSQPIHRKTPDHAERVQVGQKGDVATADDDGDHLQGNDNVDDAIAGAVFPVRLAEPGTQYSIFGDAVQHSVRTHNRRVHRPGENQRAHYNHKSIEDEAHPKPPRQTHCQPADQVLQVTFPDRIMNDHHRQKRYQ